LRNLEEEGLIRREPGRGTFVTDRQPFAGRLALDGTLEDLISMGLATSVKVLDVAEVTASSSDLTLLDLPPGSLLTRVSRIRYYEEHPYSFIVSQLPVEMGRHLSRRYLQRGSAARLP